MKAQALPDLDANICHLSDTLLFFPCFSNATESLRVSYLFDMEIKEK
jgi:hypothetical protein